MKKSIAYLIFLGIFLSSCSTKDNRDEVVNEDTRTPLSIEVSKEQFEKNNMTLVSPSKVPFYSSIKTTGKVEVLPEHTIAISTYYPGYVKDFKLRDGEYVKKGQRLFTLQNPEYVQMQQEFIESQEQLEYLKSEYDRQEMLAKENIASQKSYLKAKTEYGVTKTRYEALKKKLVLMNINPASLSSNNMQSSIQVVAPISGYVSAVNIGQGKLLNVEEVAMVITNTEHLQVQMMVFEQDIANVKPGQTISYKLSGSNDKVYGKVSVVSRAVASGTNAISVHGNINDTFSKQNIYPGMFVEAEITTKSKEEIGIPEECVIGLEDKFYILVVESENEKSYRFSQREVKVISKSDGFVLLENLKPDLVILYKGAFDLIVE